MVQAAATQQHTLPVHEKACFGTPGKFADAECAAARLGCDFNNTGVKIRVFGTPKFCICYTELAGSARSDQCLAVVNFDRNRQRLGRLHSHRDLCRVIVQRVDVHRLNTHLRCGDELHRAVDAGTGVPAAVRFQRIVYKNTDHVFSNMNGL